MEKSIPFQMDSGDADSSTWYLPDGAIIRLGKGNVMDMVLSPDGTLLAIGSYLGLWWYDVPNRSLLTLWEAGKTITTVAFSACGEWVATGGWGAPIKIWDVKRGNCLAELARDKSGYATDIIFSSDRKRLVVGGSTRHSNPEKRLYCSVEVWQLPENLQDCAATARPEREAIYVGTNPLTLSPDNHLLAFASPDGVPEPFHTNGYPVVDGRWILASNSVVVYELATGQHLVTLDGLNDISSISFSPSGKFLAACDSKGTTNVWEVPEQLSPETHSWHLHKVYQELDDNGSHYISWTPENRLLTTVYAYRDDTFSVQDLENSEILYRHPKETGYYHSDFSKGVRLAFESECDVHLWVAGENRPISLAHTTGIFPGSLRFSLDGKTLLANSGYGGIFSWDVTHPDNLPHIFKPLGMKPGTDEGQERYLSVDMSPDGKHFVISGDGRNIRLWELRSDVPMVTFPLQDEPCTAAFSPIANLLACRDETNRIHIWDITTGDIYDTYISGETYDPYFAFSPDGAFIACAPFQLYDISQRKTVNQFSSDDGFYFLAFSPDPLRIWCDSPASDNETIDLWDFQRDEEVLSLPKPKWWQEKDINTFALSTCGHYLACSPYTWTDEESVCVWDIRKGSEPIITFELTESLGCLTFSPNNTLLAGACSTGTILLWDLKPFINS
ncbi:WD40 repeat domain-containing protein [Candidatus Poribacteria bacterium]|nr:WD40 repeat domain-containing protein [Candidatus Poribacteria bacterium]MYH79219.1 WD40 repeat domain-containing protein [Candidatus Poribacteria bacterium]MYK96389.1 WD40 repeat domain-containing protein [Candidatus Poribacteria bacterium]